ncbi:alpha-1,2-fucosyltransferase [Mucilaginibacter ginsenosidivorax]|uniref:Alpha-1,2-fucosyltransferase n=1 Tax=Mucilaginibacter ginsenosidivorax TaxID=862126 RepID=A0A5B8W324_9SPHI|nr:alpha-1,2-fucosyltransferase [Mucilaginibacter ginsenosidivorax]QEC77929.1 alpha-1,2-fucosyltransferase [Mucilaginibacter ginsenosidivorax]
MIIIKLQGGLGNQMFQYAAARSISGDKPVYFDLNFLSANTTSTSTLTARHFELAIFNNIRFKTANRFMKPLIESRKAIYRYIKRILMPRAVFICQTENNEFINLQEITSATIYLDGYFQNENYFKSIREQLLLDFKFPSLNGAGKKKRAILEAQNPVALHVRRGDYLRPEVEAFHGILPLSYYQKAKDKLEMQVSNPHYFVFSDDPEWCRLNFGFLGDNVTIVSETAANTWEDMYLMSLCHHNIIANSSYSWWGAWLNTNPGKVVIAPYNWFVSAKADIVPSNWIKI